MEEDYKIDKWALFDIPEDQIEERQQKEFKYFTENGLYTCKIMDAKYIDEFAAEKKTDIDTYKVTLECIEAGESAGARANLTYFVKNENRTMFNPNTLGIMRSLGKALYSDAFTGSIPAPNNIVGGVVVAEVKMGNPDKDGKRWPKVYHYQSASSDFKLFSDIKQYWRVVKPKEMPVEKAEETVSEEDE